MTQKFLFHWLIALALLAPAAALAQSAGGLEENPYCLSPDVKKVECQAREGDKCPAGWQGVKSCPCLDASGNRIEGSECIPLANPIKETDLLLIIGNILGYAITFIGALTLLMFVWGGFQWLTSAGSPEKVKKGTDTMLWAAIGVVLVFGSYLILSIVIEYLTGTGVGAK